jgi:hypothetical protein
MFYFRQDLKGDGVLADSRSEYPMHTYTFHSYKHTHTPVGLDQDQLSSYLPSLCI